MDPIIISTAVGLVRALGVDKALGRLLAGERGEEIAGKVIDVAQQVTGLRSVDEITASLSENQQAASALRERMLELADKEAERDAQDRASARNMQIAALGQDDHFSKRFVYYFAAAWSIFAMGYLVAITFLQIPEGGQRFADTSQGFLLGTVVATVITFFFGSSKSSQVKDTSITALVDAIRAKERG